MIGDVYKRDVDGHDQYIVITSVVKFADIETKRATVFTELSENSMNIRTDVLVYDYQIEESEPVEESWLKERIEAVFGSIISSCFSEG